MTNYLHYFYFINYINHTAVHWTLPARSFNVFHSSSYLYSTSFLSAQMLITSLCSSISADFAHLSFLSGGFIFCFLCFFCIYYTLCRRCLTSIIISVITTLRCFIKWCMTPILIYLQWAEISWYVDLALVKKKHRRRVDLNKPLILLF